MLLSNPNAPESRKIGIRIMLEAKQLTDKITKSFLLFAEPEMDSERCEALYQQTNKRLHRQGQPFPVIVHHLLVQDGTDEDVIKSLGGKADVQNCLLEALKVRIKRAKEVSV